MTHTINKVEDPAAVFAIPDEADVEVVERLIRRAYNDVSEDYERLPADEMSERVARQGSLMQELIGQLNQ